MKFEDELTDWLDFDLSGLWDYVLDPAEDINGNSPLQNDFQVLIGIGIDF